MTWTVIVHPGVEDDLRELGTRDSRIIVGVLEQRIANGEPDKIGKPLSGELAGFRRIRSGNLRIVYRVDGTKIEVFVIAVGLRRDDEIYETAVKRLQ
jgi:mRNA interferase RelE/StbE